MGERTLFVVKTRHLVALALFLLLLSIYTLGNRTISQNNGQTVGQNCPKYSQNGQKHSKGSVLSTNTESTNNNNNNKNSLGFDFGPCDQFLVRKFPSYKESLVDQKNLGGLKGEEGGDWSPCTHVTKYGLNFPTFLARFLAFKMKPKRALEFGCGLGTTADFVSRFTPGGASVVCVEPTPMFSEIFDRRSFPWRPAQLAVNVFDDGAQQCTAHLPTMEYDLVYSFEVAEHIPLDKHQELSEFLVSVTTKFLFFSAGRENQEGHGHIGGRKKESWKEMFENQGLVHLPQLEKLARYCAHPERSYDIFTNLLVFRVPELEFDDIEYPSRPDVLGEKDLYPLRFGDKSVKSAYKEGLTSSLWPELDYLIKKQRAEQLMCKD